MPHRRLRFAVCALMEVCLFAFPLSSYAQDKKPAAQSSKRVDNPQELARKARAEYYNLRSEGFEHYQCSLIFDWDAMLAALKVQDPDTAARIKRFKEIHFTFSLGSTGAVQTSHDEIEITSEDEARRFNQVCSGMDQMVKGFFQTWSGFMLWNVFDGVGQNDQITDEGDAYRLTEVNGDASAYYVFGKDYVIRDIGYDSPQMTGSVQPQFTPSAKGLVLSAFSGDYKGPLVPVGARVSVKFDYQTISDLQLPRSMQVKVQAGDQSYTLRLEFSNCTAKKR